MRTASTPTPLTEIHAAVFWSSIVPTDPGGQFCDRGQSYQISIFVADDVERQIAETSKKGGDGSSRPKDRDPDRRRRPILSC